MAAGYYKYVKINLNEEEKEKFQFVCDKLGLDHSTTLNYLLSCKYRLMQAENSAISSVKALCDLTNKKLGG